MTWTLTEYLDRSFIPHHLADLTALFAKKGLIAAWMDDVQDRFLQGIPHPGRQQAVDSFKQHVKSRARACQQNHTGDVGLRSMMDQTAREYLDGVEQTMIRATAVPGPSIPHSPDYTTPGVVCTGTIVGLDGLASGVWNGRDTYSGNHARGAVNPYVAGGGPVARRVVLPVPQNTVNMLARAKPNIAPIQLLGDDRHAEDGWFAQWFGTFVTAANALVPAQPLPALAGQTVWAQKATSPRIEFLQSMPPCARDDNMPQTGCRAYFNELRAALTVPNLPILIYHYRPYEAAEARRGVATVDANGSLVNHPNSWLP